MPANRSTNNVKTKPEPDSIQIVDPSLRRGFVQLPRPVIKAHGLSDRAKVVYALLLDYAWQEGSCFPGQERLAEDLGTTERTIRSALTELRIFKLIDWRRQGMGKTNIYYILSLAGNPNLPTVEASIRSDRKNSSGQERKKLSSQVRKNSSAKVDTGDIDTELKLSKGNTRKKKEVTTGAVVVLDASVNTEQVIEETDTRKPTRADQVTSEVANRETGSGFEALREVAMRIRTSREADLKTTRNTDPAEESGSPRAKRRKLTDEEQGLRALFEPLIVDMALKLHDEAPLGSSLSRFVNDYLAGHERNTSLLPEAMFPIAYEAYSRAQYFSPSIRKHSTKSGMEGVKSKTAYWFRLVEVALGLTPDHLAESVRTTGPNGEERTSIGLGDKTDPARSETPAPSSIR